MKQSLEDKAFSDAILERYATKTQAEYNHAKSTLVYMAIGERMLLPNDTWGRQELVKRAQRIGGYILEGRYLVRVAKLESAQQPIVFGTDGYRKGFSWIKNLPEEGWQGTTQELHLAVKDVESVVSFGRRLKLFNDHVDCFERILRCRTRPWKLKYLPDEYDLWDVFTVSPNS
jgi:hypothetical protein